MLLISYGFNTIKSLHVIFKEKWHHWSDLVRQSKKTIRERWANLLESDMLRCCSSEISFMRPAALLVDDDPTTLLALPEALLCRLPRLRVETATNVVDALARLDVGVYSVVLADFRMPRMDGLALLQEVKRRHPETSVVLMTGTDDRDLEARAFEAGAFDFLTKPLERDELTTTLQLAVRASSLQRDMRASQERLRRLSDRFRLLRSEPTQTVADFEELLSKLAATSSVMDEKERELSRDFRTLIERHTARLHDIRKSFQALQKVAKQRAQERGLRRSLPC